MYCSIIDPARKQGAIYPALRRGGREPHVVFSLPAPETKTDRQKREDFLRDVSVSERQVSGPRYRIVMYRNMLVLCGYILTDCL